MPLFLAPPALTTTWTIQSLSGDYSGQKDGGTVKLTLKLASDGSFTGTFNDGSSTAPLNGTATEGGKKLVGQLSYQGLSLPIEIRSKGAGVEFVMKFGTEEEAISLSRTGSGDAPAKPLSPQPTEKPKPLEKPKSIEKPKPTAQPKPKPSPSAPSAATGNRFTHPAGLSLNLPSGWKVQQTGILTALLPPGASKLDGDELYLLMVGEANGIQSKTDPRLAQVLTALLNGPKGEGGMLLGPGVVFQQTEGESGGLTFSGANGRLYVRGVFSDPKDRIAGIVAIGLKSKIAPRESALQSAMASVRAQSPEHDSLLLGSWKGTTTTKSRDARDAVGRQQASSVTDSSTTYQLSADGRFLESHWSRTIALGQGVSLDSGDTVERTSGRWAASNGKIAFCEDSGLYLLGSYQLQGGSVVIQLGDRVITLSRG